jgi:hypothetical protein
MISDHDRHHVYEILCGHGNWFGAQLIRLIERADEKNREAIRKGFPDYVEAFEMWDHKTGIYEGKEDGDD